MAYVGVKGGADAIEQASELLEYLRTRGATNGEVPIDAATIEHQLHFMHSAIVSEGGLYDPQLASLAIKQSLGDPLEAAFFLRAYRSTRPRITETQPHTTTNMRLIRRISAAFKDVPGGQMLGPTTDYRHRLFRFELLDETPEAFREAFGRVLRALPDRDVPTQVPKVLDYLRAEGLLDEPARDDASPFDITREPLSFPCPRSAALASMSRAQQGALLGIAYSTMRGYGDVHPTVAELRVGYLPVELPHPITNELVEVGEVLVTECEIVAAYEFAQEDEGPDSAPDVAARSSNGHPEPADESAGRASSEHTGTTVPSFGVGYGCVFGHNEIKAVAMAILDRAMQLGTQRGVEHPAEDQEFVLLHTDGIEAMGFTTHWKLPHYVTFQSKLDRLRSTQARGRAEARVATEPVSPTSESLADPVENPA